MADKSPFMVVQEFISPLMCEDTVDMLELTIPDVDIDGKPVKTIRHHERAEEFIFNRLESMIPEIEEYYGIKYRGTERMVFEWYPDGCTSSEMECGNSNYLRKKWVRTKDRDLTGVLFLCDYQDKVPFDSDFEVYGGKLEFPQHEFGFNPQRSSLILFPSDPHFINGTNEISAGDLYQIRFHIAAEKPLLYDPSKFTGDYRTWFNDTV